jgi:hypothetical protein|nr:MAG TPA: hypothetical protein [Ackermannviridae sp.]
MEKQCRFCANYNKGFCTKFESGFYYDSKETIANITFQTDDTIESQLSCMELDLDEIIDSIDGVTEEHIIEIGKLFQDYKQAITKGVKKDIEENLDWEIVNNTHSITDDDEFYCKYWR